jgi:hypothetical protein
MSTRILVCGLPTSGKTTFTRELIKQLTNGDDTMVLVLNGDEIRKQYNDWDFSQEGRLRQAHRMYDLSIASTTLYTVVDFVCPLEEMRNIVKPDWTIWMDTIDEGPYENTNRIFEEPAQYDFRISKKSVDFYQSEIKVICDHIRLNHRRSPFDSSKPTVQMLGRWQPWHAGHQALFERALQKTGQVAIMVRNMPCDDKNPFPFDLIRRRIQRALDFTYQGQYIILSVPNLVNITYGRDVGYTITCEDLGEDIHQISATRIREELRAHGSMDKSNE